MVEEHEEHGDGGGRRDPVRHVGIGCHGRKSSIPRKDDQSGRVERRRRGARHHGPQAGRIGDQGNGLVDQGREPSGRQRIGRPFLCHDPARRRLHVADLHRDAEHRHRARPDSVLDRRHPFRPCVDRRADLAGRAQGQPAEVDQGFRRLHEGASQGAQGRRPFVGRLPPVHAVPVDGNDRLRGWMGAA